MFKKIIIILGVIFLFNTVYSFSGIKWKANISSQEKNKEFFTIIHAYAQNGNVRQDFVQVSDKDNQFQLEGTYWLFQGASDKIIYVNPKVKSYMEIPLNTLSQMTGSTLQVMKITISNPSVQVTLLSSENMLSYPCTHVRIASAYDMETKVALIKTKSRIEQDQEIWATDAVSTGDLASAYKTKSVMTGMSDLDELIKKQLAAQKDLGFILKSTSIQKTMDNKGKLTDTTTTELKVTEISEASLDNALFTIPQGYEKKELLSTNMGN